MAERIDRPVFDHGVAGTRVSAERFDEPGDEDLYLKDEEPDEDLVSDPRRVGRVPDGLFHPARGYGVKTLDQYRAERKRWGV